VCGGGAATRGVGGTGRWGVGGAVRVVKMKLSDGVGGGGGVGARKSVSFLVILHSFETEFVVRVVLFAAEHQQRRFHHFRVLSPRWGSI
jgi:hypothetical protein